MSNKTFDFSNKTLRANGTLKVELVRRIMDALAVKPCSLNLDHLCNLSTVDLTDLVDAVETFANNPSRVILPEIPTHRVKWGQTERRFSSYDAVEMLTQILPISCGLFAKGNVSGYGLTQLLRAIEAFTE